MAAFPAPALRTQVPQPLYDVMGWCRGGALTARYAERSLTIAVALHQFEQFLNTIYRHPGRIDIAMLGRSWQSPYDCLLYFADWRREIAVALSHVPAFFDPKWLSGDVVALRDAVAAERAFDRLPVLADALEEAGCDNPLVLAHLREPYDHAHHCWAVDLLTEGGTHATLARASG